MPNFFHVDRTRSLAPGQQINLSPVSVPPELEVAYGPLTHVLSQFGVRYLQRIENEIWLELFIEEVRRAHFPDRPSRFQTLHCAPDLKSAELFRARYGNPQNPQTFNSPILEIEGEESFIADMALLGTGNTAAEASRRVHAYWAGDTAPDAPSMLEALVPLPARVVGVAVPVR